MNRQHLRIARVILDYKIPRRKVCKQSGLIKLLWILPAHFLPTLQLICRYRGVVKFTVIPVKTGIHTRLERASFLNLATGGFRPVSEYGVTLFRRNDEIKVWKSVSLNLMTLPRVFKQECQVLRQAQDDVNAGSRGCENRGRLRWVDRQGGVN